MNLISLTLDHFWGTKRPRAWRIFPVTDLLMLMCAVLASLAAGVLAAYGVCLGLFGLFRTHARQAPVKQVVRAASSAPIAEG
jgi:hypothetical protein